MKKNTENEKKMKKKKIGMGYRFLTAVPIDFFGPRNLRGLRRSQHSIKLSGDSQINFNNSAIMTLTN